MKKLLFTSFLAIAVAMLYSCNEDNGDDIDNYVMPDQITINIDSLYPEGVDYDADENRFFITSLRFGDVGYVTEDGQYELFVDDPRTISAIGCYVNEDENELLVACSDPGAGVNTSAATQLKTASLGIYNLDSGVEVDYIDLTTVSDDTMFFANDIAVDDNNNIYVTNSMSPEIYKVTNGTPELFIEDEMFRAPAGEFGLNGIVSMDDDYLIVAFSYTNSLYKIDLNDKSISMIIDSLPASPDGLEFIDDDELAVVCNASGMVVKLESDDNWESATMEETFATSSVFPTTAAYTGDNLYVLYAYLDKLLGGDPTQSTYTLKKVEFEDMD